MRRASRSWPASGSSSTAGTLPFKCTMETQNFRPPEEKELTFSAYGYQGTDVCAVDLVTKKVVNYFQLAGPIRRTGRHLSRRTVHPGRVRQAKSQRPRLH